MWMGSSEKCTTAIRMFLFLIADGKCAAGLEASIPALAYWRLSSLPRYLHSDDVERVGTSCDPGTAVGQIERSPSESRFHRAGILDPAVQRVRAMDRFGG